MYTHSFFLLLSLFLSVGLLYSPLTLAQHETYEDLADFDKVEFVGRGEVVLYQDNNPHLRLEASEQDDLQQIRTEVRGRTLRITYEQNRNDWIDIAPKIKAYVGYPALRSLEVVGLVQVSSEDVIRSDRFRLQVEGMGKVKLKLDVASLDIESAGTANMYLSGKAGEINIVNDGTGTIDAFELACQEADVEVNGTGVVRVNASERLRAEANGFGAAVKYRGEPRKTYFDKSGFSSIKAE
ncbi:MAG: head GIN domain-containing protein [Tunicatimonas sp.]|uniref:head GIN domain-containing protein n=1 Tax=Tunicatimonas sp. TaxID=1940096 RepID=UPI003C7586D3